MTEPTRPPEPDELRDDPDLEAALDPSEAAVQGDPAAPGAGGDPASAEATSLVAGGAPPPEPDDLRDDPDLKAALQDPAFDLDPWAGIAPAEAGADPVLPGDVEDPGRPEDLAHEPGAPHLSLDEDQEH